MLTVGFVTDPEHWRAQAEGMRLTASSLTDERAKARMLKIAEGCSRKGNQLLDNNNNPKEAKKHFEKAAEVSEKVLNDFSTTKFAAKAGYYAGNYYRKIDDYQKSQECYEKVADSHAGSRLGKNAQFMKIQNYKKLKREGKISRIKAD